MKLAERLKQNGWLQLMRPPNLFSVPGDPLAGFLLAGGQWHNWRELTCVCLASLCAYIMGLLTNDLADLEEDRRERPARPLPSGRVSLKAVRAAAFLCGVTALALASVTRTSLIVCTVLCALILLYNYRFKRYAWAGAGSMALCRVMNVGMGAVLTPCQMFGAVMTAIFMLGIFLYLYGVTAAAKEETRTMEKRPGTVCILSGGVICYLTLFSMIAVWRAGVWNVLSGFLGAAAGAVFAVLAYWGFKIFRMESSPRDTQEWIGILIWNLIFIQAAAVLIKGSLTAGLALILAAFLAKRTARIFYGS